MSDVYIITKDSLLLMAEYNIWANQQLFKVLRTMSEKQLNQNVGLFFKSIIGTLNHLLVGEHYLWYVRFSESNSPYLALDHSLGLTSAQIFDELEQKSQNWIPFIQALTESTLQGNLHYQAATGRQYCLPYAATLMHVFNHGTHHRAQITAALTMLGQPCPELDLVYMLIAKQS